MEKTEIATSPGFGEPQAKGAVDLEEFDFDYEQEEAEDEITRSILQTLSAQPRAKHRVVPSGSLSPFAHPRGGSSQSPTQPMTQH